MQQLLKKYRGILVISGFSFALTAQVRAQDEAPVEEPQVVEAPSYTPEDHGGSDDYGSSPSRPMAPGEGEEIPREKSDKSWKPPKMKTFTQAQKKAECAKYENRYISYYDQIFKVEGCKRREVRDGELLARLIKGRSITSVSSDTVIMLEEGKVYTASDVYPTRSCAQLNHRYVTHGSNEIFYVEDCKRLSFPDWDTYETHREKHDKKSPVLELTAKEFNSLKAGKVFPSVLDNVFKGLLEGSAGVDVIPVDEACRGVNEKFVSYYSRLYRIERCRKREITNPEAFMRKSENNRMKFIELSSEQWLSLPDGKPMAQ